MQEEPNGLGELLPWRLLRRLREAAEAHDREAEALRLMLAMQAGPEGRERKIPPPHERAARD